MTPPSQGSGQGKGLKKGPGQEGLRRIPSPRARVGPPPRDAFTLVELLLACAVFAVMLVLMAVAIGQMSTGIRTSSAKVEAFAAAREGFSAVNRTLSTATLNTYWDYFIISGSGYATRGNSSGTIANYGRQSDLSFLINDLSANPYGASLPTLTTVTHGAFFFSPQGYSTNTATTNPPGTLNPCGFFVAYGYDPNQAALSNNSYYPNITLKPRFRLYQWMNTSESTNGVNSSTGSITNQVWIAPGTNNCTPLADNIIAFVLRVPNTNTPSSATDYGWYSQTNWPSGSRQPYQMNELPPFVEVTMVAMDETVVNRLTGTASTLATATAAMGIPSLATLFTDPTQYTNDLAAVTAGLNSKKIPYRVFTTTVPLPGSKWSP